MSGSAVGDGCIDCSDGKDVIAYMCAIAGIIGLEAAESVLEKMLGSMAARGPDGQGIYREGDCCLLHTRLAIIDPQGGRQPMALTRGGELYVLSYNGELYNTEQLRRELRSLGHRFEGHSDTEVVLHAFSQWGEECVNRFNGIFAFAVWEEHSKRLFLARDRIGVKPLFYWEGAGTLLFASEIKTILCHGAVKPRLDREGAAQLLLLGPGRLPGSGIFYGIREVEPGCCGWFSGGNLQLRRYWQLKDREHRDSFEETVESVRFLVTDSIRAQMVSDVPVGTFLSGGLDSSIITAVCAKHLQEKGELLPTFSVDYAGNDRYFQPGKFQPDSDGAFIRKMRDAWNTDHHDVILDAGQLNDALEEATLARDLPGMADVDFSLLCFCKEIRRDVKVALSGECADEIFGGYPWYRDPEVRSVEGFPWAQNTRQRLALLSPAVSEGIDGEAFLRDAYRDTLRQSDILPGTSDTERRMKEMVNLNFRFFMQTLLDRKDRMSMYSGLEVRVPFCDYRIAEYLYGVPWEMKDHLGREKGLLRRAVEGLLPEEVLYRKKSPYPKTFDPAYEVMMEQRLTGILQDRNAPLHHMVRGEALSRILEGASQWPWYGQLMRRPQTMAYFVQLNFWLDHYCVDMMF